MDNTFAQTVAHWQNFYILAGGAAATLTGLLFVAVSLHIDLFSDENELRVRELAVETLLNFVGVLVVSLLMTTAEATPARIGIPLLVVGLYQVYQTLAITLKRYRLARKRTPHPSLWRFVLWQIPSLATSAILFYVAVTLLIGDVTKLYWLIWAVIPTLLLATSTAWNMMIRLGDYRKHRAAKQPYGTAGNP